jgi:CRISPR/Cas system-associated exonuclease Cas4 (RecB family)
MDAEIRGVEGELDELRDAAISFAEKEGVQVIAGTEARLRVTGKERVVSPAKGSVEREALVRELRAAGVWDEVATLDASALERAVAEKKWAPEVNERIKAYLSIEKRYTVTISEKSEK